MKFRALIGVICAIALLAGCAGSDGSGPAAEATTATNAESTPAKSAPETTSLQQSIAEAKAALGSKPPTIRTPPGPPPSKLVVKDIQKGTGTEIEPGTIIVSRWVVVKYKPGQTFDELDWNEYANPFGPGLETKGWEKGLIGMRVGGRRKLIVPSRLAYGKGTLVYVVDLLRVE